MNKNIFNAFIVGSLAMGLASCSEIAGTTTISMASKVV